LKVQNSLDHPPHISIVTINFNHLKDLETTFANVVSQTYKNTEYIIIDGGSQDGTIDFLQEHSKYLSYWVSERDNGIYDAMNKGVKVAKGEWIIFMNSGDTFSQETTIEQIAPYLVDRDDHSNNRLPDVVYGGWESIFDDEYGYRTILGKPADLAIIWHQIPACHQSVFVRRRLQAQYPFDTSLKWCADHDLLANLYQLGCKFQEAPIVISKFDVSGGKARDLLSYTRERWAICRKYFGRTRQQELYFLNEYRSFWIQEHFNKRIRKIIPREWVILLRKWRKIY
jgi:glycosyltransferase involved in cell wall biosynthesis